MTMFGSFIESQGHEFTESALHERNTSVIEEGYMIGGEWHDQHGEAVVTNQLDQYRVFPNTWRTRQGVREFGRWEPEFQRALLDTPAFPVFGKGYVAGVAENVRDPDLHLVYAYDPIVNDWRRRANTKDFIRSSFPAVCAGGRGYSFGADTKAPQKNRCTRYDPRTNVWTRMPNYPGVYRHRGLAATIDRKIYLYTGETWQFNEQVPRIDEYDVITNTWKRRRPDLLTAPGSSVGGNVNGRAYFVGGHFKDGKPFVRPTAKGYNPLTSTWENFPSFINPAVQMAASFIVEHQNGFYVTGGLEEGKIQSEDQLVSKYDWEKKIWSNRKMHPSPPRHQHEGWALSRP